ncbi:MAG TPA: GAF domain-containing sensor histidine kinase [Anaerolineales bacterium]|nr:GAF domain-containing sensor histidine kinase [Anaerolineales bacterium]
MALISSGLELEPLLSRILDSAVTLIRATHGTIGLVIRRNDVPVIRTVAVYNMPADELGAEMSAGVGLAGRVLQTGQAILLDRYGDLEQPTLPELAEHSVIGVPVRWQGEMIGFFGIGAETPHHFNEQDLETLKLFAQYAAVAIHNARLFESSRGALDEMRLLYETSQRIGLGRDVDEVITAYLEQVARRTRYVCNVCLYEFNADGERTAVVIRGRWNPESGFEHLEERVPYSKDALDPLLDAGQTVTITDVRKDPRVSEGLRQMQEENGRLALAMIPLMVRGRRTGLVVLSYPGVYEWSETGLRPYHATAAQLATAIDSRVQQTLLYERGRQLAVLQERERLARELHDSVTQLIFSTTLIAQSIAPAWKRDPLEGQKRVDRLLELSQTALREMRSLLFELRPIEDTHPSTLTGPERVHRHGLLEALRLLAADFTHDGVQVAVRTYEYSPALFGAGKEATEQDIYRIVQEALNNTIKHARAREILVLLDGSDAGQFCLTISDDGIGFDPGTGEESQAGGFGMKTMRARAELLGGSLRVLSAPGKGTTVEVIIPNSEMKV